MIVANAKPTHIFHLMQFNFAASIFIICKFEGEMYKFVIK